MMSAVAENPVPELRPMREEDIIRVCVIEQRAYDFPWSVGVFTDCLRVGYSCWTILEENAIVGYAIMTVAAQECHVLNVCVDPDCRRRGYADALLMQLLNSACTYGAQSAYLEVRPSNRAAINLYRNAGFSEVGRRADYYPAVNGREDALVMSKSIQA